MQHERQASQTSIDSGKPAPWQEVLSRISDHDSIYDPYIQSYIQVQLFLKSGERDKAIELIEEMDADANYLRFEVANKPLLAWIDIRVGGTSNWEDDIGNPIEAKNVVVETKLTPST